MAKTNVRRHDRGPGADLINEQRAVDEAINERFRSEQGDRIDPRTANNKTKTEHKPGTSQKKTGRTKH
jgi:hypothetical protein